MSIILKVLWQERLCSGRAPLFEMLLTRPAHLYGAGQPSFNLSVTPDQNTGRDYDTLDTDRKYDSDNEEFEII